jgi:hypothetical protein
MPVCAGCDRVDLGGRRIIKKKTTRSQPAQTGITTCVIKQSCSPDDGHNDARNMLRAN